MTRAEIAAKYRCTCCTHSNVRKTLQYFYREKAGRKHENYNTTLIH